MILVCLTRLLSVQRWCFLNWLRTHHCCDKTRMTFGTKTRHDKHFYRFQHHIGNTNNMKETIVASFSLYVLDWRSVFTLKLTYAYRTGPTTLTALKACLGHMRNDLITSRICFWFWFVLLFCWLFNVNPFRVDCVLIIVVQTYRPRCWQSVFKKSHSFSRWWH